jgi:alpha-1,6-mannosyltransferase
MKVAVPAADQGHRVVPSSAYRILQVVDLSVEHPQTLRFAGMLASSYAARGYEVLQLIPGRADDIQRTAWGARITVRGPLSGRAGRVIHRTSAVRHVIESIQPDRLELHDRRTPPGLDRWAEQRRLPALAVCHGWIDCPSAGRPCGTAGAGSRVSDTWLVRWNWPPAHSFGRVVCTTTAGGQADRHGRSNLLPVLLGTDLDAFRPDRASPRVREALAPRGEFLLVTMSPLDRADRTDLAIATTGELTRRGRRVRLVVIGDGPARRRLERSSAGIPVRMLGDLEPRSRIATIVAGADLALLPGLGSPGCLALLDALACGTPAVVTQDAPSAALLGEAGLAAACTPQRLADAVEGVLDGPADPRRAARLRAQQFPWSRTVDGFLDAHRLPRTAAPEPVPGNARRP